MAGASCSPSCERMTMTQDLEGCRIVVPESRELDVFAAMLEAQGATTLRCPMVAILDLADDAAALAWLRRLAAGGFDDLVLLTGEGLRRLMVIAPDAGIDTETAPARGPLPPNVPGPKPGRAPPQNGPPPGRIAGGPRTEARHRTP